jgi:hypothetical protein
LRAVIQSFSIQHKRKYMFGVLKTNIKRKHIKQPLFFPKTRSYHVSTYEKPDKGAEFFAKLRNCTVGMREKVLQDLAAVAG